MTPDKPKASAIDTPTAVAAVIDTMRKDPDYAWSWHCNIAMAFVDAGGDRYTANQGAAEFMRRFASVEPAHELPPAPEAKPVVSNSQHEKLRAYSTPYAHVVVPEAAWQRARGVMGTATEIEDQQLYRALQAALYFASPLAAPAPEADKPEAAADAPRKPHDAGSHDQKMTPALQRVIDAADKRARDRAAMPTACKTASDCRDNGCHGQCLPDEAAADARKPYSIDADPDGIRALVCDAVTGALTLGVQNSSPPPMGHWLAPFWQFGKNASTGAAADALPPGYKTVDQVIADAESTPEGKARLDAARERLAERRAAADARAVAWRVRRDDGQYELFFDRAAAQRRAECFIIQPPVEPLYTEQPPALPTLTDAQCDALVAADQGALKVWLRKHKRNPEPDAAARDELRHMRCDAMRAALGQPAPQPAAVTDARAVSDDAIRAEFESWARDFSTLSLERDSHGGYVSFEQELLWRGFQAGKKKAPEGASRSEPNANAGLGLAVPDDTCQHEFALDPTSSINICSKCGLSEVAAKAARRRAAIRAALGQPVLEPMSHPQKLWLWKNFVDGKPEYWAFDNPFPVGMDCNDPQTLGEPCGYALFKPSRCGRTDVTDEQVLQRLIDAAKVKT